MQTEGVSRSRSSARSARCGGATMRRWTIAQAYSRPHRPAGPALARGRRASSIAGSRPTIRTPERNRRERARPGVRSTRFRPTPALASRTHVPILDDTRPPDQALVSRAGARRRRHGAGVRHAGRGTCPAAHAAGRVHRPHVRTPAPPATPSSCARAPARHGPPARPGLRHAGLPSPGTQALTALALRRPVWEDGRAGEAGAAIRGAMGSTALGPPPRRPERCRTARRTAALRLAPEGLEAHVSHVHCWRARRAPFRWGPALRGARRPVCPGRRELLPAEPP